MTDVTLTDATLAEIEARAEAGARRYVMNMSIRDDVAHLIAALRASREALRLARVVVETLSEQPSYRSAATDDVLIEINAALGEEAKS